MAKQEVFGSRGLKVTAYYLSLPSITQHMTISPLYLALFRRADENF